MIDELTDPHGHVIPLGRRPQRIVSTVPSQTELLAHLGLEDQLAGITAYCVHPQHLLKQKTVIGGTKDLQIERIRTLQPDLIIGNREENIKEQMELLAREFPVWISDVKTVDDALDMIVKVGKLTATEKRSCEIHQKIQAERNKLQPLPPLKVAYFIWKEPYMLAGPDTFIGNILQECGLKNIAPAGKGRYPEISLEELQQLKPDLVLLSSEPWSFTAKDAHFMAGQIHKTLVKIVDGALFSWYGSRMQTCFKYLQAFSEEVRLSY